MTKKSIYIIGLGILIIVLGVLFFSRSKKPAYDFIEVKRGDIVQEVSVTGRVKPAEDVDLAFEKGGRVVAISVKIGDPVKAGQALMYLDRSELEALLAGAEANLRVQQAKLAELQRGTRPEEIQVQEVAVSNAKIALDDNKQALIDQLVDAYTKSDDAIRNKIDQFIDDPKTLNPEVNFVIADTQLKTTIEQGRYSVEVALNNWKMLIDNLTINNDLDSATSVINKNLVTVKQLLDNAALAVNSLTPTSSLSQTTIDTYKSNVSTARTNINTAVSNVSTAYENYRASQSNLTLQENQLTLKKAGTVAEQITAQEAQVEKTKADVDNYKAQIAKTILRSPIDGVVTKQEVEIGEIVQAGSIIVTVISDKLYEVEVNVPEADIAKIKISNPAKITLDAYGSDVVFGAHVVFIDPAETMIEGVATYKTTLQFDKKEEMVKSGMTANIDILANKKGNVLFVPQRVIITENGDKYAFIDSGKIDPDKIKIETGLRGSDGNIEIVSGLLEGQEIINPSTL